MNDNELRKNIKKLQNCVTKVEELSQAKLHWQDQGVKNVRTKIIKAVQEIFGPNSIEAKQCTNWDLLWHGGHNLNDSDSTRQKKYEAGIPQTNKKLLGYIENLEEQLDEIDSNYQPTQQELQDTLDEFNDKIGVIINSDHPLIMEK